MASILPTDLKCLYTKSDKYELFGLILKSKTGNFYN